MAAQLSWTKIQKMSDEELRVIAMKKGLRGNASQDALKAQEELFRRHGGVSEKHFENRQRERHYTEKDWY